MKRTGKIDMLAAKREVSGRIGSRVHDPHAIRTVAASLDVMGLGTGDSDAAAGRLASGPEDDLDASLIEDFAEFLVSPTWGDCATEQADPDFRETLRRRLWRLHVQTNLRDRHRH